MNLLIFTYLLLACSSFHSTYTTYCRITLALGLDSIVLSNTEDETVRMMTTELFGMVGGIALLTLRFVALF